MFESYKYTVVIRRRYDGQMMSYTCMGFHHREIRVRGDAGILDCELFYQLDVAPIGWTVRLIPRGKDHRRSTLRSHAFHEYRTYGCGLAKATFFNDRTIASMTIRVLWLVLCNYRDVSGENWRSNQMWRTERRIWKITVEAREGPLCSTTICA